MADTKIQIFENIDENCFPGVFDVAENEYAIRIFYFKFKMVHSSGGKKMRNSVFEAENVF